LAIWIERILAVTVNLTAGSFSSVRGTNNIAIAFGAVIENALGSNHADTPRASDVASTLNGNGGNDTLIGSAGNDLLIGLTGVDTKTGLYDAARGVTVVAGDTNGNGVAEFAIDLTGNRTLTASSFTPASASVAAPPNLTGMSGADTLRGYAGNDLLDGGAEVPLVTTTSSSPSPLKSAVPFNIQPAGTVKPALITSVAGIVHHIAVVAGGTNQVWFLQNGSVVSQNNIAWIPGWTLLGISDFNGDGNKDTLYSQNSSPSTQYQVNLIGVTQPANGAFVSGKTVEALLPLPPVNEGTDTAQASIGYTLPMLASGAGNINGTGNGLNNVNVPTASPAWVWSTR
jgi:Ca2+-binding RTX toxin-like protein